MTWTDADQQRVREETQVPGVRTDLVEQEGDQLRQWGDVTNEFDLISSASEDMSRIVQGKMRYAVGYVSGGYRFRKIELFKCDDTTGYDYEKVWAFVIEKRES